MSRIIIKNIPKGTTEEKLRGIFGTLGHITDCALKFTKQGHFRKFAFIGYENAQQAEKAVEQFDETYINTAKIQVEKAHDLGDASKPRAWSKYAKDSSAFKQEVKEKGKESSKKSEKQGKTKPSTTPIDDMLSDVKDDPGFQEFLEVHKSRSNKATWSNDVIASTNVKADVEKHIGQSEHKRLSSDESEDDSENGSVTSDSGESSDNEEKEVADSKTKKQSDLEFLKSKKATTSDLFSDSDSDSSDSEADTDNAEEENSDSSDDSSDGSDKKESLHAAKETTDDNKAEEIKPSKKFIIKMKGLQSNVKEKQVHEFFKPIQLVSVKIPRNAKGSKAFCVATVEVRNEKDLEAAMRRNKNFIGPKRVYLHKAVVQESAAAQDNPRSWELKQVANEETESIAESGRLYVRNLAYICKDEDLEQLFSKYGPLTEVHLPIDSFTKKIKGFAFITFMMPEHAVKAYTELDGTGFQGRLLHILPAQQKKEDALLNSENLSFKQKKDLKQKSQASSSHNWNSLFLGANAVADVMAEKYKTAKSNILDAEQKQSLGVRMALGETQIVAETRDFLVENGVVLDAFSQSTGPRSKTCILAKNLPASTQPAELRTLFEKFGQLGRVILPPSGVTALVEFNEVTEAKAAFRNLAYTKFGHVPLYLEWAPQGSLKERTPPQAKTQQNTLDDSGIEAEENEEQKGDRETMETDDAPEQDTILFVKNLNFDTAEEDLRKHFKKCGELHSVTVARKKNTKKPGEFLSMGYGFIQFKQKSAADKALKKLQHSTLDDHQLELKRSNRTTVDSEVQSTKKKQDASKKQMSSKILVRNVPFQAKLQEVKELFSVFGELKSIRLPKKLSGTGSHRGFAFVDFLTKQDAKRAFDSLCHSTHLYGRRLVLEWADSEESLEELRSKTKRHFHKEPVSKKLKKSHLMDELKAL